MNWLHVNVASGYVIFGGLWLIFTPRGRFPLYNILSGRGRREVELAALTVTAVLKTAVLACQIRGTDPVL